RRRPGVAELPRKSRAVLRGRRFYLQQSGRTHWWRHLRWLFNQHRGRRKFRAPASKGCGSCRKRAAFVRGHYHLLAVALLENRERPKGRNRWTGRTRTHGSEIGECVRRGGRALHHVTRQNR